MSWQQRAIRAWAWAARSWWAGVGALVAYAAVSAKKVDGTQAGAVALVCFVTFAVFMVWGMVCIVRGRLEDKK